MVDVDIENQALLGREKKETIKRRISISIFVILILLTVAMSCTLTYLHFHNIEKNGDKTEKNNKDDEDKHEGQAKKPIINIDEPNKPIDIPIKPNDKSQVKITKPSHQLKFPKLNKEQIIEKLKEIAITKIVKVVSGTYDDCKFGDCNVAGSFIYEWKVKMVADLLKDLPPVDLEHEFDIMMQYEDHIIVYGMYYDSQEEYKNTYKIFKQNIKIVKEHNKNTNRLYTMKLNHFASFSTDDNFKDDFLVRDPVGITRAYVPFRDSHSQIIHVDWRSKGVVSDVVMQGNCGSCWAISATDVFNSFMSIKKKDKLTFSYQQVLDCVSNEYDCKEGGSHVEALKYIKNNNVCTHSEYEYVFKKIKCSEKMCKIPSEVREVVNIRDKDALEYLKNNGPFVTSFNSNTKFVLYEDGIYDGNCEMGRGHSVLVVGHGYDEIKKVNYWIVKNSWGVYWGEYGYFRILDSSMVENSKKVNKCDFLARCYGII